jgi:hypothetical protein
MAAGSGRGSSLLTPIQAWWEASTFPGDIALLFTIVTIGNSAMMLTGLDEPKSGTFAYVHLLGRFGIIVAVVGLFYLDEARAWFTHWHRQRRQPVQPSHRDLRPGPTRTVLEASRRALLRGGVEGTARVFTAVVVTTCVLMVALAAIRTPVGGAGLYRNLVLFALILLPVMTVASRPELRRTRSQGTET